MAVESHGAAVGHSDSVDDADERRLSGSVRSEQAEHSSAADVDTHSVEGCMLGIAFHYVVSL